MMVRVREMHCENPHTHVCAGERERQRETQSERECEREPEDTRAVSVNSVLCVCVMDRCYRYKI